MLRTCLVSIQICDLIHFWHRMVCQTPVLSSEIGRVQEELDAIKDQVTKALEDVAATIA